MTRPIKIDDIRTDGGTQPREFLNQDIVGDYADAMEAGVKFPPVDVFHDGENYWLADGFHRLQAAWGIMDAFPCVIHQGTLEDARWFSFSANKAHGLYRSNADKQRAVQAALKHPKSQGLSDSAIAKHVGVSHTTVASWRQNLESTCKLFKSPKRTGLDGRTIETSNIGKTYQPDASRIAAKLNALGSPEVQETQKVKVEPELVSITRPERPEPGDKPPTEVEFCQGGEDEWVSASELKLSGAEDDRDEPDYRLTSFLTALAVVNDALDQTQALASMLARHPRADKLIDEIRQATERLRDFEATFLEGSC